MNEMKFPRPYKQDNFIGLQIFQLLLLLYIRCSKLQFSEQNAKNFNQIMYNFVHVTHMWF